MQEKKDRPLPDFPQSPTAEFVAYDRHGFGTEFAGINNRGFICGDYFDGATNFGLLVRVGRSSDD
jgi:hypothetical protein